MNLELPTDPAVDAAEPNAAAPAVYFGRRGAAYRPDPRLIDAANAALSLGMPLLLTGEPGCGKTDFAFAVARYIAEQVRGAKWDPKNPDLLECYIRSDTRAKDLLYSYDVVARFADAYLEGEKRRQAEDPRHYIQLEPLGMAFVDSRRRVVLVDEIDKAPSDLPNDLLRELDQGWFEIGEVQKGDEARLIEDGRYQQPLKRAMGDRTRSAHEKPFFVITSNAERQLPDPFLRRCIFFHLQFPPRQQIRLVLQDHLTQGGPPPMPLAPWLDSAVDVFERLRSPAEGLLKKPSTSELLNWGTVVMKGGDRSQTAVREVAGEIGKRARCRLAAVAAPRVSGEAARGPREAQSF